MCLRTQSPALLKVISTAAVVVTCMYDYVFVVTVCVANVIHTCLFSGMILEEPDSRFSVKH